MDIIFFAVGAIVLMTVVYRLAPFRGINENKPRVAFFPKYSGGYTGAKEDIVSNLKDMGFVAVPQKPNLYARGQPYGDFSAKSLRLHVSIDDSEKRVRVYAPFVGVLFDTGDLWQVATNAMRARQP